MLDHGGFNMPPHRSSSYSRLNEATDPQTSGKHMIIEAYRAVELENGDA
jgi:hypothetical protein